ncbi:TonB-dependent receptor domain-containing protein [Devosia sp.]|uniref:TonB-dependent receptor domain-containing protein n=1 Tax=Devosia sp. TaxID=1871048 RepID=UPI003BACF1D2
MGLVTRRTAIIMGGVALGAVSAGMVTAATVTDNSQYITLLERLVIGAGAPKVAVDTPQSVTVVDQADIDQKQAGTIGEIFESVPGVTVVGSDNPMGQGFNIRGIGSLDSPTSSGDASKIIVTIDGAPKFYEQYRMGSFFSDPELYKAVEVLRGPASSTLYGSGAIGGVVNFTTKDASDFIQEGKTGALKLKTQYTSNGDGTMLSAILAHRLSENAEVLAMGNFRQSQIQSLANGNDQTGSDFETWSGLIKGTYRFGDDLEQVLRLSYQHWDSDANDQPYVQNGYSPDFSAFGTIDRHVKDDTVVLTYENPVASNDLLDLKGTLSFSSTAVEQRNASAAIGSIGNADYGYATYQGTLENTSHFDALGAEHYLTYGTALAYQDRTAEPITGGIITTHPAGTQTKAGLFAQDEITWDGRFTLTPGFRADFIHLDPSELISADVDTRDDVALSPKLAALYKLNDSVNLFGSLAHTERVPSLDEMFQYSTNSAGTIITRTPSLDLEKEKADSIELGASTQLYDLFGQENSVTFKGTAFYNDVKNGIRSNPNYISASATPGLPYFVNVSHYATWGLELEGAYESENIFGRVAYTLTRGEYLEDVSASILSGAVLDSIAQDKLTMTLGARALEGQLEYGATVTLAAEPLTEITSAAGANGDSTNWGTLDLFTTYKPVDGFLAGTSITASVENLFNADYRENLSYERSKERTFKLTLAKQFDY